MRSNFNTAPTAAPEISNNDWGFGEPISAGVPSTAGGFAEQDWGAPSAEATDWSSTDWSTESMLAPPTASESRVGEHLRELKDRAIHGIGRKALDAVMNRLPSFKGKDTLQASATNLYEDPTTRQNLSDGWSDVRKNAGSYGEQASQTAKRAGREIAGAGVSAAKEAAMTYYGLEKDENEKLRIARKLKFGKAVVKTLVNPVGTASSVGVRASRAAKKAAKQEAFGQLKDARQNFVPASQPQPELADW